MHWRFCIWNVNPWCSLHTNKILCIPVAPFPTSAGPKGLYSQQSTSKRNGVMGSFITKWGWSESLYSSFEKNGTNSCAAPPQSCCCGESGASLSSARFEVRTCFDLKVRLIHNQQKLRISKGNKAPLCSLNFWWNWVPPHHFSLVTANQTFPNYVRVHRKFSSQRKIHAN